MNNFAAIKPLIRTHFQEMEGYSSAGMEVEKDETKIFLNANENPYTLEGLEGYNYYPEPQPRKLVEGLSDLYDVPADNLLITRGADEGIAMLLRLFCEPHQDSILIHPPTFGVYKVYASTLPVKDVVSVPLIEDSAYFHLDISGMVTALENNPAIKMVFITSPNNPTGGIFPKDDIETVIKAAAKNNAMVILDETYAEFSDQGSLSPLLPTYPNLIILRTLSKSYAFAGMRIGTILSGVPDLITTLKTKVMEAYPIPRGSTEAALKILAPDNIKRARANIQTLIKSRKDMEQALRDISGVRQVYASDSNFLLIRMDRAQDFCNYAAKNTVILRDFSAKPGTEGCLRIAIGRPADNEKLLNLLKAFYQ